MQSRSPVKMRFVFRNPRNAEPLLVSSVQPLLTFHEMPFDWSKIDVATDLKITASASGFEIKDDGAGPAVSVKYRVATGALDLIRGEYPYLLNQTATLSFRRTTLPVRALELDQETPPGLVDRAYRPIGEAPIGAPTRADTDPSILRCGGSRFEIITTLARLSELTPVVRGGTATLEASFETLRGKAESRSASATLPEDLVFVKETPELLFAIPARTARPRLRARRQRPRCRPAGCGRPVRDAGESEGRRPDQDDGEPRSGQRARRRCRRCSPDAR